MLANYKEGNHSIVEAYKSMRTSLSVNKDLKTILVTSSEMNEGKTTTVSNLARCFSDLYNLKVLIIDCDLRNPSIHKHFGIDNYNGLIDLLSEDASSEQCIKSEENLQILTCGKVPKKPSEILDSDRMREFIFKIRDEYDYIFIDSPPVSRVNDACIIAKYVDGTIIVSGSNQVSSDLAKITKERLEKVNANIIGVVLNKFKLSDQMHYHHYVYGDYEVRKKSKFSFMKRNR